MKFKNYFLAVLMSLSLPVFAAEGSGSHGGDIFHCDKNPSLNTFSGDYLLDYVMTVTPSSETGIVELGTSKEYLDYIANFLKNHIPEMAINFEYFINTLPENFNDSQVFSTRYIWQKGPGELFDIKDENIIERSVPSNCHFKSQAVIKMETVYNYDEEIFQTLPINNPRQYSFLVVHEWLRTYLTDTRIIRMINTFLHTKRTQDFTSEYVKDYLDSLINGSADRFKGTRNYDYYNRNIVYFRDGRGLSYEHLDEMLNQNRLDLIEKFLSLDPNALDNEKSIALSTLLYKSAEKNRNEIFTFLKKYSSKQVKEQALKDFIYNDLRTFANELIADGVHYDPESKVTVTNIMRWIEQDPTRAVQIILATRLKEDDIDGLIEQCLDKDSMECLNVLKKAQINIDKFVKREWIVFSHQKSVSIESADLLLRSALKGKMNIFNELSKSTSTEKKYRSHIEFWFLQWISMNGITISRNRDKSFEWLLKKRVKELERELKNHCIGESKQCLDYKRNLKSTQQILSQL